MRTLCRFAIVLLTTLISIPAACQSREDLADQVRTAEIAFAGTMARRDADAFATFIDDEAVFFGYREALRGVNAIRSGWSGFFVEETAPFSWSPEVVEVLASGTLALSSGPVYDPDGRRVGTFNSIWRLGEDGRWKVVFDKGCPPCDCDSQPQAESGDQDS